MGIIKCFQITESSKFAISLQYLKKEVRNGDHFWYAVKHKCFYKFLLSFLMEVARQVQNTQNRNLVKFLQYIRKKVATALCLLSCKTFRCFTVVHPCSLLLVSHKLTSKASKKYNRNIFNPLKYTSIDFIKLISQEMINL